MSNSGLLIRLIMMIIFNGMSIPLKICHGGSEINTSPLVYEILSNPGKYSYQCVFFNAFVLSKFILDITDIGEG